MMFPLSLTISLLWVIALIIAILGVNALGKWILKLLKFNKK